MHAILEVGNKQYKVSEKNMIEVDRIEGKEQDTIKLDKIILANIDNKTTIGNPTIKNSSAKARIIRQFKDDKVIVFRKNRRHNFRRKNGHRQHMTLLEVEELSIDGKVVKLAGKGESSIGKFTLDKIRQKQIANAKPMTRSEKIAKGLTQKAAKVEKKSKIEPEQKESKPAQKAQKATSDPKPKVATKVEKSPSSKAATKATKKAPIKTAVAKKSSTSKKPVSAKSKTSTTPKDK